MSAEADTSMVFGIDLGTTNTCVAIATGKGKHTVCNFGGKCTLPSVVSFTERLFYIGHSAVQKEGIKNREQTVRCAKRLMGRTTEEIKENGEDKLINYKYGESKDGTSVVHLQYRSKTRSLQT